MSPALKSELVKTNKYWIDRHRYYELKHFCLQYPNWKRALNDAINTSTSHMGETVRISIGRVSDTTGDNAISRAYYSNRIDMIEKAAMLTSEELGEYVLKGVTEGVGYDVLRLRTNIPCCRDVYYDLYRRFFWILDKLRE